MEKSYSSTRKKLTAAIAMLLIAALMVVTATYAWFTLSTSPEVTGITTTVGANGNLEIALGSTDNWGDPTLITSAVGDSNLATVQKNLTWGNIVDLSAADYHLNDIILNPARLNIDGGKIGASPLKTPTYGNDGRVAELLANTVSGIFADGFFKDGGNGVRVLGTASGMTDQQLAYRNAKSSIANAASSANAKAAASLNESGSKLADIIVKHATSEGDADTNTYNIEFIDSMITKLTDANAQYETVVRQYFIAAAASRLAEKVEYDAAVSAINGAAITDLIATGVNGITLPAGTAVKSIADIYTANAAAIAEATTKFGTVADKTAASWTDTKAVLDPLVNTANVTVNGIAASEVKNRIDDLASAVMGEGLKVEMPSGSGVYSNFADVGGNYSSSIVISELTYGSVKLTNINATMTTKCTNNYAANIVYPAAPANAEGAGTKITDSYGYALDFWFRTNASGSDLLLQEAGQQRVYEDSTNAATMGGGSYMEFESTNANFTTENVEKLMQAIRIVFADKEGTPLAYAKLGASAVTGSKVKAPIELWAADVAADGKITYTGDAKLDSQKITALTANTPTAISVYVYLDGDVVDNGAVANAATSMTGSMNLQFASSATLTPMKNTPLYDGQ